MDNILSGAVPIYFKIIYIIFGILLLTVLQKFHYLMLFKLTSRSIIISLVAKFMIRIGVIIHELSHLIFGIISFSKVKEIKFFDENGGSVSYESKDYIGNLPQYYGDGLYWFRLFFNQIGIFLISMGPLIVGMIINYFMLSYFFNVPFGTELKNLNFFSLFNDYLKFIIFIFYIILFLPNFILSFQDILNFLISKSENIAATIIASILNILVFICFLGFLTFFYMDFINFLFFYLVAFAIIMVLFTVFEIIYYLLNYRSFGSTNSK